MRACVQPETGQEEGDVFTPGRENIYPVVSPSIEAAIRELAALFQRGSSYQHKQDIRSLPGPALLSAHMETLVAISWGCGIACV